MMDTGGGGGGGGLQEEEDTGLVAIPADTHMMVHVMNQLTVHQALILLIVAKQYSPVVVAQPTAAVIRMIAKQYSQISHISHNCI